MQQILQYIRLQSTLPSKFFYVIVSLLTKLRVLKGFLIHSYFKQGAFLMNILDILRRRILEEFPDISEDEMRIRLSYASELLKNV
jgi:hypothetical protein